MTQNKPWFDADLGAGVIVHPTEPILSTMLLTIDYRAGRGEKTEFEAFCIVPVLLGHAILWNLFTEYGDLLT